MTFTLVITIKKHNKNMVKDYKYLWTEIYILEIMRTTHHNNMANITGQVEHFIVVSLYQVWDMVRGNGKCCMVTLIKESIWMIRKMGKGLIYGKMGPNTLVSFKMITDMDMVRCNGMMVDPIKVSGSMEYKKMSPYSWIMGLTIKSQKIKILSIQFQSLFQDRKNQQCQKDTIFHLFKKNK